MKVPNCNINLSKETNFKTVWILIVMVQKKIMVLKIDTQELLHLTPSSAHINCLCDWLIF